MNSEFESSHWSVENVRLSLLTHRESFRQTPNENYEKPFHSHVYYELLYSAKDASADFLYENRRLTLAENTFVIIAPYYSHRTVIQHPESLFSLGFLFKKNNRTEGPSRDLYRLFRDTFASYDCIIGQGDEELATLCNRLKRFPSDGDILEEGGLSATFMLTLLHVVRLLQRVRPLEKLEKPGAGENAAPAKHSTRIQSDLAAKINNILSENFMTDITPEELFHRYYVSPKQINRYIRNQYGQTFLQRKTYLRMTYAMQMLRESDLSIREISEKAGYHSINSFYSAFKTQFGTTPNQYRRG